MTVFIYAEALAPLLDAEEFQYIADLEFIEVAKDNTGFESGSHFSDVFLEPPQAGRFGFRYFLTSPPDPDFSAAAYLALGNINTGCLVFLD